MRRSKKYHKYSLAISAIINLRVYDKARKKRNTEIYTWLLVLRHIHVSYIKMPYCTTSKKKISWLKNKTRSKIVYLNFDKYNKYFYHC